MQMLHTSHSQPATGLGDVGNNFNIQHHAGVFVVENVAVYYELADVTVIALTNVYVEVGLDEDRVLEGMQHAAILVRQRV